MQLIPPSYRRCFYHTCKDYLSADKSNRLKWRYRLNCAIFADTIVCLSLETYLMASDYQFEFWRIEPLTNYFYEHRHLYDPFLFVISFLFVAFNFFAHYLLYHLPTNSKYWQWNYEHYVTQCDWYYQCLIRDEQKLAQLYTKKHQQIMSRIGSVKLFNILIPDVFIKHWINVDMFLRLENLDKEKFFRNPLTIRPNLSREIRTRNILVIIALDKIYCVILLGYVLIYCLFSSVYFPMICAPFPWYLNLTVPFYAIIIFDYISQIIMLALFVYTWGSIELYSTGQQCKQMYSKLAQIIAKFKRVGTLPIWHARVLQRILFDHTRICVIVIRNNRDIWAAMNFAFLLTNMPVNIYLISKVSLLDSYPIERAICFTIFALQTLAYTLLIVVADEGTIVHLMAKCIPTLQTMMNSRAWLWTKLKYNDLYKRLLTGPKYVLSIGPNKEFTRFAMMEVLCIYVGYLFMAFSNIIETRTNNSV